MRRLCLFLLLSGLALPAFAQADAPAKGPKACQNCPKGKKEGCPDAKKAECKKEACKKPDCPKRTKV